MARNRFDVDETLETPFNIKHLLRAGVYIKRHKQKMILSLVFSAISAACALVGPKLIETALNVAVPNRDYKMLFILAGIMLLSILLSIFFSVKRSRYMTVVGQAIMCDVRLSLVVMAGIPLFLIIVLVIKPAQRRAWQDVSNKSSNLNAYLHESLDGMKITQAFTREEENAKIYNNLNTKMYKSWMKAQYTSNLVWFSVNNISTWVVGAMYLVGFSLLGPAVQIGTLIAISAYAWRFWQPILQLSNLYNTFINAVAYLERIFEMIDEPVLVDDAPDATELPPIKGDVTFDHVSFKYNDDGISM